MKRVCTVVRRSACLRAVALLALPWCALAVCAPSAPETPSSWPQQHSVARDDAAGTLAVSTPYYAVTHDLTHGGAISAITYPNGRARSLLVRHMGTWVEDARGNLQHNFFRDKSEFGVQMCLKSGWSDYLKLCIDRVLTCHPLDGVYYDWNVALYCCNPSHVSKDSAAGHWDIDELLSLMEWTRRRVGPNGLVIVHNTTAPMFATENFADHVVATEWGYKKWTDDAPPLQDLPLEWNFAGARSRGVISYGVLDGGSPRRLHRLFALEALLGGVTPWPASPETFEIVPVLKPLGALEVYRFADWRQTAVSLSGARSAAALYSRPGETYALLVNLDKAPQEVRCVVYPENLPHPIAAVTSAELLPDSIAKESAVAGASLDAAQLTSDGVKIVLSADSVRLLHLK